MSLLDDLHVSHRRSQDLAAAETAQLVAALSRRRRAERRRRVAERAGRLADREARRHERAAARVASARTA